MDKSKNHFAVVQVFEAFFARNDLTLRRKNGRHAHQVLRGYARITKGQLKGSETLLVPADALGEEKLLRDHALSQFLCSLRGCEVGFPNEVPERVYRIQPVFETFWVKFIYCSYRRVAAD